MAHEGSTRDRLMDAAERLLAEHGAAGTSVRDVLTAAQVANASAIGYHFGGKDALVAAVERRVVEVVNAARSAALERAGSDLHRLVEGWVRPIVELRCAGRGPHAARVFTRIFDEPSEQWARNGAAEVLRVTTRYRNASAPSLPGLDQAELFWRWQAVTGALAFYAQGFLDPFGPPPRPADVEGHVARLVAPLTGLLAAPEPR